MELWANCVIILILIGITTLIYIVGGIMEALVTYIKHSKEKKSRRCKHNSPVANGKENLT